MGLFKRKAKADPEPVFEQSFTQSKSFRGHRRFYVSYYGYKEAEKGLAQLRRSGSDLRDAKIQLRKILFDDTWAIQVYVNDFLVGSVFETSCNEGQLEILNDLSNGLVNSAHVRIEDDIEREQVYLFLKSERD